MVGRKSKKNGHLLTIGHLRRAAGGRNGWKKAASRAKGPEITLAEENNKSRVCLLCRRKG